MMGFCSPIGVTVFSAVLVTAQVFDEHTKISRFVDPHVALAVLWFGLIWIAFERDGYELSRILSMNGSSTTPKSTSVLPTYGSDHVTERAVSDSETSDSEVDSDDEHDQLQRMVDGTAATNTTTTTTTGASEVVFLPALDDDFATTMHRVRQSFASRRASSIANIQEMAKLAMSSETEADRAAYKMACKQESEKLDKLFKEEAEVEQEMLRKYEDPESGWV